MVSSRLSKYRISPLRTPTRPSVNRGFPELTRSKSTRRGSSFRSGSTEYKAACSMPTCASTPHMIAGLGEKKPGTPVKRVENALHGPGGRLSRRDQNSCRRSKRRATGFPAMIAPLMAPIEVPITQSGSMPASWSAW